VFAYNEQAVIADSLRRLLACGDEAELSIHVLINGCTDDTEAVVQELAASESRLHPVPIRRGDKANAWNHYVHLVAPDDAVLHVFTDGDMEVSKGSVKGFVRRFAEQPVANACAGMPLSGRNALKLCHRIKTLGEMYGNLYALRAEFVARIRAEGVRLPFGIFGEDGLVAALAKCDLDPRQKMDLARITWSEASTYRFEALSPWKPECWRIYRNRRRRYALRWQQSRLLWSLLSAEGVSAMPAHVVDLYRRQRHLLRPRLAGLDTVFDWEARRRILRDIEADDRVKEEERAHLYS
jgi:glycosyltransferase involved in cell wall biosynthesis